MFKSEYFSYFLCKKQAIKAKSKKKTSVFQCLESKLCMKTETHKNNFFFADRCYYLFRFEKIDY